MKYTILLCLLLASCATTHEANKPSEDRENQRVTKEAHSILDKSLWSKILVITHLNSNKEKAVHFVLIFKTIKNKLYAFDETGSVPLAGDSLDPLEMAKQIDLNVIEAHFSELDASLFFLSDS